MSIVCDTTTIIGWSVNGGQLLPNCDVGIGAAILASRSPYGNGALTLATLAVEPIASLPAGVREVAAQAASPIPLIALTAPW